MALACFDLIRLGLAPLGLEIEGFLDVTPGEYVMTTSDPFIKAQSQKELAPSLEFDVRVGTAGQYLLLRFGVLTHRDGIPFAVSTLAA